MSTLNPFKNYCHPTCVLCITVSCASYPFQLEVFIILDLKPDVAKAFS